MAVIERGKVAERLFTADEVALIVGWFGGNPDRWRQHVEADSEVVNVGHASYRGAVEALREVRSWCVAGANAIEPRNVLGQVIGTVDAALDQLGGQ
jgi:hypothetical protein